MTITVGIVNYNTKEDLKNCLYSILHNPPDCNYSIWVVDNNSSDGSQELLRGFEKGRIRYILNKENKGFGSACNQIARKVDSTYLLFLNADVLVSDGAINRMISFMDEHTEVGLSSGKLLNSDGTIQLSCRQFPTIIKVLFGRDSMLRRIFPDNPISRDYMFSHLNYNEVQFPDWIRGAVLFIRTDLFKEVNGFDEQFFLYLEDTDLCLRLTKNGYKIAYIPDVIFYHKLGASTKQRKLQTRLIHNISMFYYLKKHFKYNYPILFLILIALFLRLSFLIGIEIIKRTKR
ncbi:glycosyltransferase family 2 protein [candidate division WOR-3 bacterium]|nr:glycosyltransferase family 2 protein [candidate division WOR-3 bacterium]